MSLYVRPDPESLKRAEDAEWRERRAESSIVSGPTVIGRRDHEAFWRQVEAKRQAGQTVRRFVRREG